MKSNGQNHTLALYMSTRFSTPFWGVHVRGNTNGLSTLCGMAFDDDGNCTQPGRFSAGEFLSPADYEIVSCPQCVQFIEELKCVPVDLPRAEAIRENWSRALSANTRVGVRDRVTAAPKAKRRGRRAGIKRSAT